MPSRRTPAPDWVLDQRKELGQRIMRRRQSAAISQDRLAEAIGMDRRSIQRYEAGDRDPTYGDLLQIARALGVPIGALTDEAPPVS